MSCLVLPFDFLISIAVQNFRNCCFIWQRVGKNRCVCSCWKWYKLVNVDERRKPSSWMCHSFISCAFCCQIQLERLPFSGYILVSVEVRPVSKNCHCSWYATAVDCPSSLVCSCLLADQYSSAHFYMGLGRQSAAYHSILNSLYCTLAAHETHVNGCVGVDAWKFVTLRTDASFCAVIFYSTSERAAEVLYVTQWDRA